MTASGKVNSEPEVMRGLSGRGGGATSGASLRGGSLLFFDGAESGDYFDGDAVLIREV